MNQLRTIYDNGREYFGTYEIERESIIEVFKKACMDFIKYSHLCNEKVKIENVFITKNYCLSDFPSNVSDEVTKKIGFNPVNTKSNDWFDFLKDTKYLQSARENNDLDLDYGKYPIICMASIKNEVDVSDIKDGDVIPIYSRSRNKIIVTDKITENIIYKVNKIYGIYTYFKNFPYFGISIPDGSIVIIGDNWYIVFNNEIIHECVLEFDEYAIKEYNKIKEELSKNNLKKLIRS